MLAVRWRSNRRNSLLCQTPTSDYRERDIQLGVVSAKVYVITKLVVLYANTCVYFVRIIHKACTHGTSLHPCSLIHLMAVVKYHRHFCCFLYLLVNWLGCLVNCFKQVSFTTGTHLSIPTWIANSYEFGYTTILDFNRGDECTTPRTHSSWPAPRIPHITRCMTSQPSLVLATGRPPLPYCQFIFLCLTVKML